MSAEVLRVAARLMRERANAATPGPWYANPGGYVETHPFLDEEAGFNMIAASDYYGGGGEAAHIASWHPAVALAVADLLDAMAETFSAARFRAYDDTLVSAALAVARAYLGAEVPA